MKVIGAGFGRTGTMSMQGALQILGFRCYHMKEVPQTRGHLKAWHEFVGGKAPMDWQTLFEDYEATVDFPACWYYKELLREFPDAKVVLTVRDPRKWFDSFTTLQDTTDRLRIFRFISIARRFIAFTDLLLAKVFDGRPRDRAHCIEVFDRHNQEVKQHVPADRLLVFQVQDGWEPLCRFLECDVPKDVPFPHLNEGRKTLQSMARQRAIIPWFRKAGIVVAAFALVALGWWLLR